MIGITEISKGVSKKNRISEAEAKGLIAAFLEVVRQELKKGEDISFKGYFTLKRAKKTPEGSKFCSSHTKRLNDFKRANQGKGVAFYAKSPVFKKLKEELRKCKDCENQKKKMLKVVELLPRINCKASKGIWDK
ncbi:MAG: HU family DNA-binding protein [Candidatus Moeniiplasma glomeromycotorum]|nr:HU family DNA-binding protein [Candidatus Moeniiplasma glomeromycotorum]MCE8169941.1 HU family DNA-binding protein [Candidatus Moeniiplasma glomeromycotorum]